ncbi:MAG TPA: hypothetical protein VF711_06930 [Acidimicrobiales bacterium]
MNDDLEVSFCSLPDPHTPTLYFTFGVPVDSHSRGQVDRDYQRVRPVRW